MTADDKKLVRELSAGLRTRKWTLATAESCTGGLLGDRITDQPGSSVFFRGGVIAYSNRLKEELLGVRADILREQGAVSPGTARAMARAVRTLLGATVGVAISGIAGPGGGSPAKPVGLVYVAVVTPKKEEVKKYHLCGTRRQIKLQAAGKALALLLRNVQ
ncbi:MAG: CinA family protein [PVC group bacterium]